MESGYRKLNWQENKNGFVIDCELDLFVNPTNNKTIFLTIPGIDGSIDGYENKYAKITESYQKKTGAAIVRMSNNYISPYHWQSNVRRALDFILKNKEKITNQKDIQIHIMSHSAGAAVTAQLAWEYPVITKILLVNTAFRLKPDEIISGLEEFKGDAIMVFGGKDPSIDWASKLENKHKIIIVENADHLFSGNAFPRFLELANEYLS